MVERLSRNKLLKKKFNQELENRRPRVQSPPGAEIHSIVINALALYITLGEDGDTIDVSTMVIFMQLYAHAYTLYLYHAYMLRVL